MKIKLECNDAYVSDKMREGTAFKGLAITPLSLGEDDYWVFRVKLTEKQSVVAFPKFFTLGIGFQVEEKDWNTNLPYTSEAEKIFNHIKVNKGDKSITKANCIKAIQLLQEACAALMVKKDQ